VHGNHGPRAACATADRTLTAVPSLAAHQSPSPPLASIAPRRSDGKTGWLADLSNGVGANILKTTDGGA